MSVLSNNNSLTKDTSAPDGEEVYQSKSTLKKFDNPDNITTGKQATIITKINLKSGDIDIFENVTSGGLTIPVKIRTIKSDGTKDNIWNPDRNKQFFDSSKSHTKEQLKNLISQVRQAALPIAKKELPQSEFDALKKTEGMKSTANTTTIDPNSDALTGLTQSSPVYSQSKRKVPRGKSEPYRYPKTVPELGYDFIRIKSYKYKAGGRESLKLGNRLSAKERLIKNNEVQETIILPMQPNFSESNAVSWGGEKLNPLKMMGAGFASGAIEALGSIGTGNAGAIIGSTLEELGENASAILNDPTSGRALIAYFAGQAVGANILGRSAGVTLNPNLELLFNGPNLRTFSFNFRFTPRSKDESEEVREIIRVFKKNMAVQRSDSNLFLLTPNIFTLEYIYNSQGNNSGQIHPYLNIFKPMAMTNLNVNYTPDGSYMTYNSTGSLTQYDLQMSFGEIEPIYADEYGDEDNSEGGDFNKPINMGY